MSALKFFFLCIKKEIVLNKMIRQKMKIYQGQPLYCPYMVVEVKLNRYTKVVLILAKR